LLASCCDDRGELLKTVVINIEIPNKTRRKRASARRIGLKKLMDWILGVMATALVPWRLVIGRIGRIGHGELRGKIGVTVFNQKTFIPKAAEVSKTAWFDR
jgi:mediator of RNA polymerase II transcription subunit 13